MKNILQKIINPEDLEDPFSQDNLIAEYLQVDLNPENLKFNDTTKILHKLFFHAGKILTQEEDKLVKIHLCQQHDKTIEYLTDALWSCSRSSLIEKKITEEEDKLVKKHIDELNQRPNPYRNI